MQVFRVHSDSENFAVASFFQWGRNMSDCSCALVVRYKAPCFLFSALNYWNDFQQSWAPHENTEDFYSTSWVEFWNTARRAYQTWNITSIIHIFIHKLTRLPDLNMLTRRLCSLIIPALAQNVVLCSSIGRTLHCRDSGFDSQDHTQVQFMHAWL